MLTGFVIGLAAVASASASAPEAVARVVHKATTITSTPDGDTFAEASEQVGLSVEIRNIGAEPATGITATLTSSQITVQQATSAYPDLAPGAAATTSTPFTGTLRAISPRSWARRPR